YTIAGNGQAGCQNGPALEASFRAPTAVAASPDGTVFVCDAANHCIRRISGAGQVNTLSGISGRSGFADGSEEEALFAFPCALLYVNHQLIIADFANNCIRVIDLATRRVRTIAGKHGAQEKVYKDGALADARFHGPTALALDLHGRVLVADQSNARIRRIDQSARTVCTVIGNGEKDGQGGLLDRASLRQPTSVLMDSSGD